MIFCLAALLLSPNLSVNILAAVTKPLTYGCSINKPYNLDAQSTNLTSGCSITKPYNLDAVSPNLSLLHHCTRWWVWRWCRRLSGMPSRMLRRTRLCSYPLMLSPSHALTLLCYRPVHSTLSSSEAVTHAEALTIACSQEEQPLHPFILLPSHAVIISCCYHLMMLSSRAVIISCCHHLMVSSSHALSSSRRR